MKTRVLAFLLLAVCAAPQGVTAQCNVNTSSVAFGDYDIFRVQPTNSTGSVLVSCDVEVTYTITLSTGAGGSYSSRSLMNGARVLAYNLYIDSSRMTIWGDGTGETSFLSATGTVGNHAVYGSIPARQNAAVGFYTDTITVTLTF